MLIKKLINKTKPTPITLKNFYEKRNKILFIRNARGLGDIFMARMLFEDVKILMPDAHITFACSDEYHIAMKNHPFVDEVISCKNIDKSKYNISYDISTCCWQWESAHSPNAGKHRADIWADYCGFNLKNHNMHLPFLSNEILQDGILKIKQLRNTSRKNFDINSPTVLFCPIAFERMRTLLPHQIKGVIDYFRRKNIFVFNTHHSVIPFLEELEVPMITGNNTENWLSLVHASDYVVTVDTSVFHYAGGIKKPMTGIFTHVDGKYRGQYFDFTLVQKHRENGNWQCGPCYNYSSCSNPRCTVKGFDDVPRPCVTELTVDEIICGLEKMFQKCPYKAK